MKLNKLGLITAIEVSQSYGETITADISLIVQDPGSAMRQFHKWMNGEDIQPEYQEEYMCLYCASPNKIKHTHCKKCGAPRSFLIG